jgi:hypothetical protein
LAIAEGRGLQKGTHGDITGNHSVMKRSAITERRGRL